MVGRSMKGAPRVLHNAHRKLARQHLQLGPAALRSSSRKGNPATLAGAPGLGQVPRRRDSVLARQGIAVRGVARARGPKMVHGSIGGLTMRTRSIARAASGSHDSPRAKNSEEKLVEIAETGAPTYKHRVR